MTRFLYKISLINEDLPEPDTPVTQLKQPSGKSTFIRKFMETKVIPYVTEDKNKIIDELPQSSAGKTIMTVEPKFVPSNPANITIENEINLN